MGINLAPTVIYEDGDILALNKPAGLVVHADGRTEGQTLADWVLRNYPDMLSVGEPVVLGSGEMIKRPGIVHRLDRETSGIIVIAKTQQAFGFLKKQFQDRVVTKTYRAFVYGILKDDEGIINRPIGKSKSDFRKWSAQRGARGELREAITEYRVLKRGKEATYLEVRPKTGRTHQIRVHFKAIHHPVVCDKLYAPKHKCILGFERLALHAYTLALTLPSGGEQTFEEPLPGDFKAALKNFN